ncbi:type I-C CRISPR-associated protein Cas7/Csd2 [Oceanithermus sp.]
MSKPYLDPSKRHEFVLLFDVKDGNPNGDPDAGNMPRVDPETMQGLVTDVALKRKVRDYVTLVKQNADGYKIFIQSETALNALIEDAAKAADSSIKEKLEQYDNLSKKEKDRLKARPNKKACKELCRRYYDIRLFGGVLSTGKLNAGQVRGPVQLTFARSLDPVLPLDLSITRVAITTQEDLEKKSSEMGRKPLVPYGLYRAHGFFNPYLAEQTGVSPDDLELFWDALVHLFDFDRSAARGEMNVRGLVVFTHENKKGNAPAHKLFELVKVRKNDGIESPRSYGDYAVFVGDPPEGVVVSLLVPPNES